MRCPYCGNENPEGNRFCGMCGGTLLAAKAPTAQPQQVAASGPGTVSSTVPASRPRAADSPRPPDPDAPASISGPSFLGLNDPAPARASESRRKGAGLSITPESSDSRNLDYLLQDDEEPRSGGGAGKILLILVALALAVGLGYMRWKNQSFGGLRSSANKPAAAQKDSAPPDSSTATAPSTTSASQPPAAQPTSTAAPANATTPPANPAANSGPAAASPNAALTPPATVPKSDSATTPATSPAITPDNPTPPPPAASAPDSSAKQPAAATSSSQPAASSGGAPDQPETSASAPETPAAAPKPVPRIDPVTEAQKYLYGRGVAQDCDRGLRLLKPAANRSDSKAMIEMGALYSAGLCTPHDLPTAYRWFALALRKDPSNEAVQTDLSKLWSEMTQPERQLAIKLTQ